MNANITMLNKMKYDLREANIILISHLSLVLERFCDFFYLNSNLIKTNYDYEY